MEYTSKQKKAIKKIADKWKLYGRDALVTVAGYAGTGKTTIVREAIRTIEKRQGGSVKICYACYTGKAARVLQGKLNKTKANALETGAGSEVSTLHRLLYSSYPWDYFDKESNPNVDMSLLDMDGVIKTKDFVHVPKSVLGCDIVVIDEASMVPLNLWNTIRKHRVMLICLGDPAQLPPIDNNNDEVNGRVVKEPIFPMIDRHDAYDVFLDEIMRQNSDSGIIQLSMQARALPPLKDRQKDGWWSPIKIGMIHNDYMIESKYHGKDILDRYIRDIKADGSNTSKHIMLCFKNTSRIAINKHIHKALGYNTKNIEPGERVVCLRNSSHITSNKGNMLVNGLMGICIDVYHSEVLSCLVMDIDADGEIFKGIPVSMVDWAYCLTVHKSQGSEWENVLLLDEWYELWLEPYAQWLYTGITRAQRYLCVLKCKVKDFGIEEIRNLGRTESLNFEN